MYMNVSNRITNILNYYKENEGCDPNVYEYITLCNDVADYLIHEAPDYGIYARESISSDSDRVSISLEEARNKYPIPAAVHDKFLILAKEFKKKLLGNDLGITEDSDLYRLCQESTDSANTYALREDVELRAKVGGVALYMAQEKRNVLKGERESFTYDNYEEMNYINQMQKMYPVPEFQKSHTAREVLIDQINSEFNVPFTKESTSNKSR
ncbi:MAG: hypothetical protein IJ193_05030 [Bacilli bacterium]|nr:hypothetical protein [Bacilli bacterium]